MTSEKGMDFLFHKVEAAGGRVIAGGVGEEKSGTLQACNSLGILSHVCCLCI